MRLSIFPSRLIFASAIFLSNSFSAEFKVDSALPSSMLWVSNKVFNFSTFKAVSSITLKISNNSIPIRLVFPSNEQFHLEDF